MTQFKTIMRGLLLCGSVLLATCVQAARSTGDSYAKAKSITFSAKQNSFSGKLVEEYDADLEDTTGSAVYYFKASLKKGYSYTIWTTGGTEDASLSVDSEAAREDAFTWFNTDTAADGYNAYGVLAADDWDEDDKSTETFYFCVSGDAVGQSFRFYYQQGEIEDTSAPLGTEARPQSIRVSESEAKVTGQGLEDEGGMFYYQTASLNAGEKYYFAIKSSDTNEVASLSFEAASDSASFDTKEVDSSDVGTTTYAVDMNESGSIYVIANCNASYTLTYWKLGAAKPAAHEFEDLVQEANNREIALSGEVKDEECKPLYRNNTDVTHKSDIVIDQALYRVKLARNTQYRFRVEGEDLVNTDVTMEVYDANGNIVAPTEANAAEMSEDGTRVTVYYTAAADTYYYVGVCQTDLDDATGASDTEHVAADITCTFSAMPVSDSADPKDDVATGATSLTFKNTEQVVTGRTLCGTDVADWYKFSAKAGTYYTIELAEGAKDGVSLAVYVGNARGVLEVDEDGEPVDEAVLTDASEVVFAPDAAATYYVCVMRDDVDEDSETAYSLAYLSTNVGQVQLNGSVVRGTDYMASSVRSTAGSISLRVKRTAKEGRVRVRYTTKADTAIAGEDYVATVGELEWADGDNKDKTITIPIIPELNNLYRGNRTFYFELLPIEEELAEDEWPASLGTPSRALVTIQDANKAAPGKISFVAADDVSFATPTRPTATLYAGSDLRLTLSRTDGSDGVVGVLVQTTASSAKAGTDFEAVSETIYWDEDDTDDKEVSITALDQEDYTADKTFTVKMTALSASKTETNVTQRATLGASSVTVTLRNDDVKMSSAEYTKSLGSKPLVNVRPGSGVAWYIDQMGDLTTAEIAAGKKADITLTVTGPGKFECEPYLDGDASVKVTIGRQAYTNLDEVPMPLYLGKGSQTLRLEVTADKDGDGAMFSFASDIDDGEIFKWTPLALPTCVYPVNSKGVVSLDSDVALMWDDDNDSDEIAYNIWYGTDQRALTNKVEGLEDLELLVDKGILEANKTYYWRVDSCFGEKIGDELAGEFVEKLVNTNSVWSFKTVEAAPTTEIAIETIDEDGQTITTVYSSAAQDEVDVIDLQQGVKATFALGTSSEETSVSYSLAGGKLPDGLKIDTKTGTLTGVPTKAGEYTATLQVKAGKTTGATLTLAFDVEDAGIAVGSFTGLAELVDEDENESKPQESIASVTLTTTAAGSLTAKAIVAGTTYSFRATGFDASTNEFYAIANFEATAKFGKETVTNTLSVVVPYGDITNNWADCHGYCPQSEFEMLIHAANADRTTCTTNHYEGTLLRDSMKVPFVASAAAKYVGYYTVSLPCDAAGDESNAPQGASYITATVDARGSVRVAGQLADGTSISSSSTIGFLPELDEDFDVTSIFDEDSSWEDETWCTSAVIPVFYSRNKTSFGGWLFLTYDEENDTIYADQEMTFYWNEGDATKTYDGEEGYSLELTPTGGWFDKTMQLYTYYLNQDVSVYSDLDGFTVPEEAYPAGYDSCVCDFGTSPVTVSFAQNKMSVAKRTLVKQEDSRTLNDFEASTNACNVSLSFTRATGIFSGSFGLWFEGEDKNGNTIQRELSGLRYQGVLTPVKDPASFNETYPGMGYVLVPTKITADKKTRTWNASYFFGLVAEEADEPAEELDDGSDDDAGDDDDDAGEL